MRSRYNPDGSIDYEADREIKMLRRVDAQLERLRRMDAVADGGGAPGLDAEESLFRPTMKLLRKAGHLNPPAGMTQLELFPMPMPMGKPLPLPHVIQPPTGIPEFLKPRPKLRS
jgi:hypothetical protein